jgi:hypothetical protein
MKGAVKRIRPKVMTVSVLLAGHVPITFSNGTGADVMKLIAASDRRCGNIDDIRADQLSRDLRDLEGERPEKGDKRRTVKKMQGVRKRINRIRLVNQYREFASVPTTLPLAPVQRHNVSSSRRSRDLDRRQGPWHKALRIPVYRRGPEV